MSESDADYFQRRADKEIEQARLATKPEVAAAHHALAEMYLGRVVKAREGASEDGEGRPAKSGQE